MGKHIVKNGKTYQKTIDYTLYSSWNCIVYGMYKLWNCMDYGLYSLWNFILLLIRK